MKTLYASAFVLFITLSFSVNTISAQEKNTLIAIFKGSTEDYLYKFLDSKNETHLFYDVDEPETEDDAPSKIIDLSNDKLIGKKFEIIWIYKNVDELDSEGEETGEIIKVKSILTIKEI